jgi:uncharacterized protein involved in outer membrane biogenesis
MPRRKAARTPASDTRVTLSRRRRAAAIALGIAAVLAAALAIGESSGWPVLRSPLQSLLQRSAGVPVALDGRFHLSLIGQPSAEVGRLRVAAAQGLDLPHLVDGRDLRLAWRWGDLWRWRQGDAPLRLRELSAQALDAHVVRDAQGRASWRLGRGDAAAERGDDDMPQVDLMTLRNGHVRIADAPFDTALAIDIGGQDGSAAADAGYRARVEGRWRALELALDVKTGGALPLLRSDGADVAPLPLRVQGRAGAAQLAFDGQAQALWGARRLDGLLQLSGPSLAEVAAPLKMALPSTPPFELRTRLVHDAGLWQLGAAQARIGRSRLAGDLRFDARTRPGRLTGTLTGARLALGDLGPAVGAPVRKPVARAPGERVLPQRRFDLPALDRMNADLQIALDELDLGTDTLAPLGRVRTRLVLQDGVLDLRELDAVVAGGRVAGSTRLDATRDPARWGADLRLAGVRIDRWLQGTAGRYISGVLSGDLGLRGTGRSTAQILGSLDGKAQLHLRDGALSHLVTEALGLDVAEALGLVIRGDKPLPLRCASADVQVQDGVARLQRALLDNRDSTIRVAGSINLRNETLELAARTRSKDFSPLALRAPITVTGPFARPQLGVEGGKVAGRVVGALVLGAVVGPVAALIPLADPGSSDAGDPCAAPQAATPQKPSR